MYKLNEELLKNDLIDLVSHIFEIDTYQPKMGSDKDIAVITFTTNTLESAKDVVNFVERGYDFVLDGEYTPGELNNGKYKVFVEIERNNRLVKNILEMLYGLERVAKIDGFKFRYYKSFHSMPATLDIMNTTIPITPADYEERINNQDLNNFSNFFSRSYVENVNLEEESIVFKQKFSEPLWMKIVNFGDKTDLNNEIQGKMMVEHKDMAEIVHLSKYIGGEYNIMKIDNKFVFENGDKFLILSK